MNAKALISILVLVVIIGGGSYFIAHNSAPQASGPVRIGIILPLSGDLANLGESARNTMQLAADKINASGGIHDNHIELVFEDGECNGAAAASAMQKLANVDHLQAVIGAGCSGESLSAVPIATEAKVAMLSPFSSSPALTGISPYFARNYPSDAFQAKIIAGIAHDKGYTKVAVIAEQTDYGQALAQTFDRTFSGFGGTAVTEQFLTDATDFRTPLAKLKGQSPDALFVITQSSPSAQKIFKQLSDMGWHPTLLLSDVAMGDPTTITQYASLLEGAIGAEFSTDPSNQKLADMVNAYKAKYGQEPTFLAYMQSAYDAVFIMSDAIRVAGYDGTKIAAYLHSKVKDWQGAAGSVTIGPDGDPTSGHKPEIILNGKTQPYTK